MESVLFIYVGFFLVLVCPCQLFVRLWYHVSDVLDLSLVSKRFGFWPHITHVIVLTFKEIKHLSDCRTIGLSDYRSDPASFHKAKNSIQGKTNCKNVVKHAPESSGNQWKGNCWGTCMVNPWFIPTYLWIDWVESYLLCNRNAPLAKVIGIVVGSWPSSTNCVCGDLV